MDSVKYERFPVDTVSTSVGEEKRETKKSSLPVIGLALVVIALVAVLVAAIAIGVGMGVSVSEDSGQSAASGLTVSTMTQEELQGEYYGSTGGISFKVTVSDSHVYISVTTSSGDPVVFILNVVRTSTTLIGVDNTYFLMLKNQPNKPKYMDYVIPENYTNVIESLMEGQEEIPDDVLRCLNDKTVNETRRLSLDNLALSQEGVLITEAAQALGSSGVIGIDYPAAMRFYLLALELAMIRDSIEGTNRFDRDVTKTSEQKRDTQCSEESVDEVCAECPLGSDCSGLCGIGCRCSSLICGNCCFQTTFCRSYETCCEKDPLSSSCISAIIFETDSDEVDCTEEYDC